MDIYKPLKTLSLLAIIGLGGMVFFDLLDLLFSLGEIISPETMFSTADGENISLWFMLISLSAVFRIPVFIFTIVVFLMWMYRGFKNLPALKSENTEFTPGWAVGYWFIPFINLVKPFQAMRELWVQSDPFFDPEGGYSPTDYAAPTFVGFWWACWIISNITNNISARLMGDGASLSTSFLAFSSLASIFGIIAGVLAIIIVRGITQRQEQRFQRLGILAGNFQQPPLPPVFN